MSDPFASSNDADVKRLVDENPLGWIISTAAPHLATPMPLMLECDDSGKPATILGHLPRAHPLCAALFTDPGVQLLFQGPHAYITPEWLADKNWAPTWNFVIAKLAGQLSFDETLTDDVLSRLVAHMEAQRSAPWSIAALGGRYQDLRSRVIGFTVAITHVEGRFKLGQDERPAVFDQIVAGLAGDPLATWMERFRSR